MKKNEIAFPVSRGFYLILLAVLSIGIVASLIPSVSAQTYSDIALIDYCQPFDHWPGSSVDFGRSAYNGDWGYKYCQAADTVDTVVCVPFDDFSNSGFSGGTYNLSASTDVNGVECPAFFSTGIILGSCTGGYSFYTYASWPLNITGGYTPNVTPLSVTTWIQAVDGRDSSAIHGSDIQIGDVMSGLWVNTTNEQDGTSSITTNTTTTIDAYAQATGYESGSRTGLIPADVVYEIIMWPVGAFIDPGPSNVNLAVIVNDKQTTSPIESANVKVTIPTGATTGGTTNAAGTETFVVPNMSVIHITVSKSGYRSASAVITTSAFGPDTKRIELDRLVVTPTITATPLPGEVTARPTMDTRSSSQKDTDMMEQIRDAGPDLISLAIVATFMGLLGLMTKSFK